MIRSVLATLVISAAIEAAPFPVSEKTSKEISHIIRSDENERYDIFFDKICEVKSTLISEMMNQRDCDLLALQTALAFGKTGPDIVQQLRQSAIRRWNKQQVSPMVKQAILTMLTYGMRPGNGYAVYDFEHDYLDDLSFNERVKAKKEFEDALAAFWPVLKKQLKHEWIKRLPKYEDVDAAAYEAGLDHEAALDIYAALLGHQIYGWIVSGFGGEETTFNEIPMPPGFEQKKEWLRMFYNEASQLENKWHHRINDRNYYSPRPAYFTISERENYQTEALRLAQVYHHSPSDIRPELVVMNAAVFTEKLPQTIGQVCAFSPKDEISMLGITERLFNQDILATQRRFAGIGLGHHFYHQIEQVAENLGMIPIMESEETTGFRRAQIPERSALLHVAMIRNNPELADLITKHEGRNIAALPSERILAWWNSPYNVDWTSNPAVLLATLGNTQRVAVSATAKPEIKTVSDLGNYLTVIDNTLLTRHYPRKRLEDLRHQMALVITHPKAEAIHFNINPEFRASLEKILSGPILDEFQAALLEDHLLRLEQLADRQIGYDPKIIAHSAFYREKFVREAWPNLDSYHISESPAGSSTQDPHFQCYTAVRRFLADGQRVFRRLQQLEIEVMTAVQESGIAPECVLQDILSQWERGNFREMPFAGKAGVDPYRLQWNLVMREIKDSPETYGNVSAGDLYKKIGNLHVPHVTNFSNADCLARIVKDYVPGLGLKEFPKL